MGKLFVLLSSFYIFLALVFQYVNISIFGYGVTLYLLLLYLVIMYLLILIVNLRRGFIPVYNSAFFGLMIFYNLFFIIFSRSLDHFPLAFITALQLILFFTILPRYLPAKLYIKYISYSLLLFSSVMSIFTIINNFETLEQFYYIGFNAKKYVVPIFSNINYDATIITYGVFSSLLLYKYLNKRYFLLATILNIFALFLTYSRTSYLACIVMILAYFSILIFNSNLSLKKIIVILIGFIFIMILSLNSLQLASFVEGQGGDILTGRDAIWKLALDLIKGDLFLGKGLNYWEDNIVVTTSTHSTYLNYLVEYGLLGLLFFIILSIYIFTICIKVIRSKIDFSYNIRSLIVAFIVGNYLGIFFETRRIGGLRIIDILPVFIISFVFTLDSQYLVRRKASTKLK